MKKAGRIFSVFLAVVLLFSTMPAITVQAENPNWQDSGVPDTAWYAEQTALEQGGEADPYVIDTAGELAGLASLVNNDGVNFGNKYIRLDADIDLSGRDWTPIGDDGNFFTGNFDGNGHIIRNLTRYAESWEMFGLFGSISVNSASFSIKNLGMVDVNIDGMVTQCGAIAAMICADGYGTSVTIENCFAAGRIYSDATTGELGGLIGEVTLINAMNCTSVIRNCYTACNISLNTTNDESWYTRYAGGLIGNVEHFGGTNVTLSITDSYSTSRVTTENIERSCIGGFVGQVNTTSQITMDNCLFDIQAAGISYGFDAAGASFSGVQGRFTSEMTGTGALPASWDTSAWSAQSDLYPQLKLYGGSDSSLASAIPVFLFENGTIPALSDTSTTVRHDFAVPVPAGVTWSAEPSGILAVDGSGNVNFTSPAKDTNVTLTAQLASGAERKHILLCKSGVDAGDSTAPELAFGTITPLDYSASINVTSNEPAEIYILVKAPGYDPDAGEIVADSRTKKGKGMDITAAIGGLQHSTNYKVYCVGIDATGNVSDIISSTFTTLVDQAPPDITGYSSISMSGGEASFSYAFNESGTVAYVILPANQPEPSKEQVADGQDASGNPAEHSYNADYLTAGAWSITNFDISSYAPDSYIIYMICEDGFGNKSNTKKIMPYGSAFSFEIKGTVTFTITDGTSPVEGADVKVGTETIATDTDGKAVFTLNGGSYAYQIRKTGYQEAAGTLTVDSQTISKEITLTALGEDLRTYTFTIHGSSVPLTAAKVTIGGIAKTTDASGQVEFYLGDGYYDYTVTSMGYITKSGNITISGSDGAETVTLDPDPDGVAVKIINHTVDNLEDEIDAFMSSNGIPDSIDITAFSVSGGSISSGDILALRGRNLYNELKTIDFSGTSFEGNSIPDYALNGYIVLTEVTLPDSVTDIGSWAFYNCTSLKDIYTTSTTPPTADYNTFNSVASGAAIHVPAGTENNYLAALDDNPYDKEWYGLQIENIAPVVTPWEVRRTSETTAEVDIGGDEPGYCYYAVVKDGAGEPVINTSGSGEAFDGSLQAQINISGLEPGAYDVYIKAKDLRDNVSETVKMDIEEYVESIDVVINNHQIGDLIDEIEAYLYSQGIMDRYDRIRSLKVSDGELDIDDWDAFDIDKMAYAIQTIDLSGTSSKVIPDYIFSFFTDYSGLTDIYLPIGIESIGEYAFTGCGNLKYIRILSPIPPTVGEGVFGGVAPDAAIHVPGGSAAAYKAVDDGDRTDDLWYGLRIVEHKLTSAVINPVSASFDLAAPKDITTTITWNDATVVEAVYGRGALKEDEDYSIDSDILTIKEEYLLSLNPDEGESTDFEISFDVGEDAMLVVDFVYGHSIATGSVSGTVTDGTGPVEGAVVSLIIAGSVYSDRTERDGSYTIASVPVGTDYTVTAKKTGYISGSADDITVRAGETTSDVDIILRIKNSGGNPSDSRGRSGSAGPSRSIKIIIQPEKKPGQPIIAGFSVTPIIDGNGHATVTIPQQSVAEAIVKALSYVETKGKVANGISIALNIELPDTAESLGIVLPQAVLKKLVDTGVKQLEVNGIIISLDFDLDILKEIQKLVTGDVTIIIEPVKSLPTEGEKLIGARPVYDIRITYVKDGRTMMIDSLNKGNVILSIPYIPDESEVTAYLFGIHVDENGKAYLIPGSVYDEDSRSVVFPANHFSIYGVGYQLPAAEFTDVANHWAKESIDYVLMRGLFRGTSDTTFSPDMALSRGMLVTVLGRLACADVDSRKTGSFTDVKGDSYYAASIEWAYEKGIIKGIGGGRFAPDRAVTREELAVILQNYTRAMGYSLSITQESVNFADDSSISDFARDAVKTIQRASIMNGKSNGCFDPQAAATRAEVAGVIHNYVRLVGK